MKFKNLCLSASLLIGAPFLVNCSSKEVISYFIEADTSKMKTTYMIGDQLDISGLVANLVELKNGKVNKKDQLFTFRLSVNQNKPLTQQDNVIYVLPPESFDKECLPGIINLTFQIPTFGLGDEIDFNTQYPDYTFTSDKPYVGNVDDNGYLHTYREGKFNLVGEHATKQPVFLSCSVSEDEDIKYDNFFASKSKGNFILELDISPYIPTNSSFLLIPSYKGYDDVGFYYEFTNPELFEVETNPDNGKVTLKTKDLTGSSRVRIKLKDDRFKEDEGKLLYDLYAVVTHPFTPYEIQDMLADTQWLSYAASGEQFAINFISNKRGNLSGTSGNMTIDPIDFEFSTKGNIFKDVDRQFAEFECKGQAGNISLGIMRVDVNFGQLMLYNSHGNSISIFNIIEDDFDI